MNFRPARMQFRAQFANQSHRFFDLLWVRVAPFDQAHRQPVRAEYKMDPRAVRELPQNRSVRQAPGCKAGDRETAQQCALAAARTTAPIRLAAQRAATPSNCSTWWHRNTADTAAEGRFHPMHQLCAKKPPLRTSSGASNAWL